jgi:hypothetical protein
VTQWPEKVTQVTGLAPGEMRLLRKVTGSSLEDLDTEDQVKATIFAALVRLHMDPITHELDVDPAVMWDAAEWVQVEPDTTPAPTPTAAAS